VPQRVSIPGASIVLDLASGEEIRIEISTKFRPTGIVSELSAVGFSVTKIWFDQDSDFAVTLAHRV